MKKTNKLKKSLCFLLAFGCVMTATSCTTSKKKGDVTTIKWYTLGNKQIDQEKVMAALNEDLKSKCNVNLDLQLIDAGAYNDKMNMIVSSGEKFDLCYTSNWTNNFTSGVYKNAYIALDEYLETDRKALYESLPEFLWDDAKVGGKIMAVPNYQPMASQASVWIPTEYAEKYNLDVNSISSIFDLEPFLKKLKENEPDIYPVMAQDLAGTTFRGSPLYEGKHYDSVMEIPILVVGEDNKVYNYFELDEFKKELELFRDWYKKGYTRKDIISAVNSKEDDITALKYGAWFGNLSPTSHADALKKYGVEVTMVPLGEPYIMHNLGHATMTAVSRTSKQPKEALAMLEVMFTDKNTFNLLCYGIEGEHYKKVSDNKVEVIDNGEKYNISSFAWAYGNLFNSYCSGETSEETYEKSKELNETAVRSPLRGLSVDTSKIATEMAKVASVKAEYDYVVLGAEDYEPIIKEAVEKMETAGIDIIKDELQRQVDEFVKNKK